MSKLLVVILGLLAFALLCYLCISKHLPEFAEMPAAASVNANTRVAANTNVNNNTNAGPARPTPGLTVEQAATQGKINEKIAGKIVEFNTGSDQLTAKGKAVLDEMVPIFKEHPNDSVEIGGYSDSQGDDAKNLVLSDRRAASVKAYLVSKGLSDTRFSAKGYGEAQPVADNNTADGRQKNRRIAFTVKGEVK